MENKTLYECYIYSSNEQPKPIPNAFVVVIDSADRSLRLGKGRSDADGKVTVETLENANVRVREKLEFGASPSVDLIFFSPFSSSMDNESRQMIYCEGRDLTQISGHMHDRNEARYLRVLFGELSSEERMRLDFMRPMLDEFMKSEKTFRLVYGPPGRGKSSFLRQLVNSAEVRSLVHHDVCRLFCYSFETDNSTRLFIESFSIWLEFMEKGDVGHESLSIDKVRTILRRNKPIYFFLDAIDEMSNSGLDRGYLTKVRGILDDIIEGRDGLGHHRVYAAAQRIPWFLSARMDQVKLQRLPRRASDVNSSKGMRILKGTVSRQETSDLRRFSTVDATVASLRTGDLLLASDDSNVSELIRFFTGSTWSHVGMVVKSKGNVFLLESSAVSKVPDKRTGKLRAGVQIGLLSQWLLSHYESPGSKAAIRRLRMRGERGILDKNLEKHGKLWNLIDEVKGRPYELDLVQRIRVEDDDFCEWLEELWESNEEDLSSLFSSELVAHLLQQLGVLNLRLPSNEFTPADFESISNEDLEPGYAIGSIRMLEVGQSF